MLPTIPCKTVAFLEKLICLPLALLWVRASEETAVHSEASMAASEDISAHWCCPAVSAISVQAPQRYSVRSWEKGNALQGSETSRTAIQYGGLQSSILSLFHLGKSHFCTSQEKKKINSLFCSQAKTVTWQWSIANNKHQQNFARYHSGYTSWSLFFPLYFGCLTL